jgi:hypothetical protein
MVRSAVETVAVRDATPHFRLRRAGLAAVAALFVAVPTAGAATVANPGPFTAQFTSGQLSVMDGQVNLPFSEASPVTASGTIDPDGNISVPASGLTIPVANAVVLGLPVAIQLGPFDVTGTLDPRAGTAALSLRGQSVLTISGTTHCTLGSPTPLEIPLTTGASGVLTGVPYNAADGTLTLVSGTFNLTGVTCDDNGGLAPIVDGLLSGAGRNHLRLTGRLTPPIAPAEVPAPTSAPGCTVPSLKTLTLARAKTALKQAGCSTGRVTRKKSRKKKGTVIGQSRRAGTKLTAGSKIDLTVSKGLPRKKRRTG